MSLFLYGCRLAIGGPMTTSMSNTEHRVARSVLTVIGKQNSLCKLKADADLNAKRIIRK